MTQLALAWLLAQGDDIVPIPGTRSPDRLAENIAAADVTLSADDLKLVDEILPGGSFGSRYAAAQHALVGSRLSWAYRFTLRLLNCAYWTVTAQAARPPFSR